MPHIIIKAEGSLYVGSGCSLLANAFLLCSCINDLNFNKDSSAWDILFAPTFISISAYLPSGNW